jgi:hypothetical protein
VLAPDTPVYSHRLCVDSPTVQVAIMEMAIRRMAEQEKVE